ncbi:hypothetical protein DIJ64_06265 [Mycobacterium leprae]|uniref:Uncharacterized protein n=1 Tax=Mycobacterium leprae TaxID=1769 RepID=A0AAD0KQN0_MYCLR|nr:hypothetical protein [Mycobacterium leprae]AWV47818.1 hypothetical protein DIJ64_06265 [Mycobacterium leprae]OAR19669.1 hypothetical protein A8144_04400 [Mycobacterium leprae 3125609]OAX71823.1 hypothetical protein A3216_03270 [Mycobacterium leprae 7935681]
MIVALAATGIVTTAIDTHVYEYLLPKTYTVPYENSLPVAALAGDDIPVIAGRTSADDLASSTPQVPNIVDT